MLIKNPYDRNFSAIKPSEITPESVYHNRKTGLSRRALLTNSAKMLGGLAVGGSLPLYAGEKNQLVALDYERATKDSAAGFYTPEALTPYRDVTSYNNFYEFGTAKSDPAKNAHRLVSDPWSVKIEGEVNKPGTYTLEDILKPHHLEERIYRLRCVEAWSMVIPWIGFPLADLIKRFEPTSKAKYVAFETLKDRKNMVGMRSPFSTISWPYVEGLRMDEAMHPLTILAVGLYGKELPKQNGAPLRLIVPWKYGFKSIKSIVKIRFTKRQPPTSWNRTAPKEYGFYSNVNPAVSHPRWSQSSERRLPSSLFKENRIETLPFNGYAEQVAGLYTGMNLRKYF